MKSIPKSGKYVDIYFKSFWTESSLHIFKSVEMANDATDLLLSVIKLSNSAWQIPTSFGYYEDILFITLKAAYLFTGLELYDARAVRTWNGGSTSITEP